MWEFWKRPKFWIGLVIILWLAYIIGANLAQPVTIHLIPVFVQPTLQVATIVIGSAVIGCLLTLLFQFLWRRKGSSKNGS
jgi:hypothetical protein